ncbi:hypothetical protein DJ544_23040 [Enterobacter roggenkampii]|nr:hypothetical protein D4M93_21625 [Enterobacter roggenkampii]TYF64406.1 hypothetical protein DJ544_23040 [Enterobacter roggenkampii]
MPYPAYKVRCSRCRVAASPYPAYKVRCSCCRVAATPYPAYRCAIRRPGKRSATRQQQPQFCNTDDTRSWVYG